MKKSLVALAVLASVAGSAAAQSSVTLFGVIDAAAQYTETNGQHLYSLVSSGNTTSRIGVRGEEDLGDGLKAGFWLESQIGLDTGSAGSNNALGTSAFWGRRSTVSLMGGFGEVRLGRYKNATKLAYEDFDPSNTTGLGSIENLYQKYGQTVDFGRFDNMVTYLTPGNLGGFYGEADVAAGEGTNAFGKMYSGRVGFKTKEMNLSAAYMEAGVQTKYKLTTLGASYDFGVAKPGLVYTETELGALGAQAMQKQGVWTAVVTVPLGTSQFWAAYSSSADKSTVAQSKYKADQWTAGYTYNLSKRTCLYTVVARIENGAQAKINFGSTVAQTLPVVADATVSGYSVGMRHSF